MVVDAPRSKKTVTKSARANRPKPKMRSSSKKNIDLSPIDFITNPYYFTSDSESDPCLPSADVDAVEDSGDVSSIESISSHSEYDDSSDGEQDLTKKVELIKARNAVKSSRQEIS